MPGPMELAIVLVIVLIVFGPGRLPKVFEAMGSGIKKFREAQREDPEEDVTRKEIPSAPVRKAEDAEEIVREKATHG
jgi:sec-independent protein translocase protein TatA